MTKKNRTRSRTAGRRRPTKKLHDPRLQRFEEVGAGGEFYHNATRFVKRSASSAWTTVTHRLQRFTPATLVRRVVVTSSDRTARQLATDAYEAFVAACDHLHV